MKLPGFTAESSLGSSARSYRARSLDHGAGTRSGVGLANFEGAPYQNDFVFTDEIESTLELADAGFFFDTGEAN